MRRLAMAREYVDILLAEESGEVSVPLRVGGSMRMEFTGFMVVLTQVRGMEFSVALAPRALGFMDVILVPGLDRLDIHLPVKAFVAFPVARTQVCMVIPLLALV